MQNPTVNMAGLPVAALPATYRTTGLANGPMATTMAQAQAIAAHNAAGYCMPHPGTLAFVAWQLHHATSVARRGTY